MLVKNSIYLTHSSLVCLGVRELGRVTDKEQRSIYCFFLVFAALKQFSSGRAVMSKSLSSEEKTMSSNRTV